MKEGWASASRGRIIAASKAIRRSNATRRKPNKEGDIVLMVLKVKMAMKGTNLGVGLKELKSLL